MTASPPGSHGGQLLGFAAAAGGQQWVLDGPVPGAAGSGPADGGVGASVGSWVLSHRWRSAAADLRGVCPGRHELLHRTDLHPGQRGLRQDADPGWVEAAAEYSPPASQKTRPDGSAGRCQLSRSLIRTWSDVFWVGQSRWCLYSESESAALQVFIHTKGFCLVLSGSVRSTAVQALTPECRWGHTWSHGLR